MYNDENNLDSLIDLHKEECLAKNLTILFLFLAVIALVAIIILSNIPSRPEPRPEEKPATQQQMYRYV